MTTKSDTAGSFALADVPVGSWRLVVTPHDYPIHSELIEVRQEALHIPSVILPPSGEGGVVGGTLFLPPGLGPPALFLHATDGSGFMKPIPYTSRVGRPSEERRLTFELDEVPFGSYMLRALGLGEAPSPWIPAAQPVRPPASDLTIRHDQCGKRDPLIVRAIASEGQPLSSARIWFGLGGALLGGDSIGPARPFDIPDGTDLRWKVSAHGHRPAKGDASAIRGEGDRRALSVGLIPGWGTTLLLRELPQDIRLRELYRIEAIEALHAKPLEDVEVFTNDSFARSCDADGVVHLDEARIPEHLKLRLEGWRLVGTSNLESFGIDPRDLVVVWFAPRARKFPLLDSRNR